MATRHVDPVEQALRALRAAVYVGDGSAALRTLSDLPVMEALQCAGDGPMLALTQRVEGSVLAAKACAAALADVPGELDRCHRFADDRRRGRARAWLADHRYRPPCRPSADARNHSSRLG